MKAVDGLISEPFVFSTMAEQPNRPVCVSIVVQGVGGRFQVGTVWEELVETLVSLRTSIPSTQNFGGNLEHRKPQ